MRRFFFFYLIITELFCLCQSQPISLFEIHHNELATFNMTRSLLIITSYVWKWDFTSYIFIERFDFMDCLPAILYGQRKKKTTIEIPSNFSHRSTQLCAQTSGKKKKKWKTLFVLRVFLFQKQHWKMGYLSLLLLPMYLMMKLWNRAIFNSNFFFSFLFSICCETICARDCMFPCTRFEGNECTELWLPHGCD